MSLPQAGNSAERKLDALNFFLADIRDGTGHFNVSQEAIATGTGVGAALSTGVAGFIVVWAGYSAAFLFLAGVAGIGLVLFAIMMPETAPSQGRNHPTSKERPARVMSGR